MTQHIDILDSHESLRTPFVAAIGLHGSIVAALVLYGWLSRQGPQFGDPNPAPGAVAVESVSSIPLPHQGQTNPVASESESQVPENPDIGKQQEKIEKPPPDAIRIKDKKVKQKIVEKTTVAPHFKRFEKFDPNQLTSSERQQVSNPMFAPQQSSSGQVGTANTTLGSQFAGYAAQIQSIVARNWRTGDVDARIQTAPRVIATFDLMRDGTVRSVTLIQSSGISALDDSVKRAILDSNPLPPIPAGFQKDSARVEFTFELKR